MEIASETLQPPTTLSILWGALALTWTSRREKNAPVSLPEQLGSYALVSRIEKVDHHGDMAIGVYEKENRRYLVKRWQGETKDLNYYFLVHEYFATKIMARVIREHPITGVSIPDAVACLAEPGSLSVVFEFIEGCTVSTLKQEEQSILWERANGALTHLNQYLTPADRRSIGKRGLGWYLVLALGFSLLLILFRPSRLRLVGQTWRTFFQVLPEMDTQLVLNHRDLTPSNLLLGPRDTVYILDLEALVLTLPDYDRAYLMVDPESGLLARGLEPVTKSATYIFLQHYIVLHHILGSGSFLSVNEKYLQSLATLQSQQ